MGGSTTWGGRRSAFAAASCCWARLPCTCFLCFARRTLAVGCGCLLRRPANLRGSFLLLPRRYYNDLYELDLDALKWTPIGKPGDLVPPSRSGCQLARCVRRVLARSLALSHRIVSQAVTGMLLRWRGASERDCFGQRAQVLNADAGVAYMFGGALLPPPSPGKPRPQRLIDVGDPPCLSPLLIPHRLALLLPPPKGYRKEADEEGNEKGVVLSDCWQLNLKTYAWSKARSVERGHTVTRLPVCQPRSRAGSSFASTADQLVAFLNSPQVKRQGIAPGPRSGFCMAPHKARAVLFGGCVDHETKGGEVIVSEFYNEMFTFQFDTQRWYPLGLRGPPQPKGQGGGESSAAAAAAAAGQQQGGAADGAGGAWAQPGGGGRRPQREPKASQPQTPAEKAATRIQAAFRGFAVRKVLKVYKIGGVVSEMLYAPALGALSPNFALTA